MLNLAQVRQQVKQINPQQIQLNSRTLAGQNEAYRQLKALGWTSSFPNVHPVDRVPFFSLGEATIRRDKKSGGWIVEIGGEAVRVEGLLSEITALVKEILSQAEAPSLSTITFDRQRNVYRVQNGQLIGEFPAGREGLKAAELAALKHDGPASFNQYLELVALGEEEGRARRAARLVQRGHVDLDAGTVHSQSSDLVYQVNGICECEDYQRHGEGCKHQLALRIAQALADEAMATARRKQADKVERRGKHVYKGFAEAPGDGGLVAEDFDDGPIPEYKRMLAQEMARRERLEKKQQQQPANIGEEIQQLLGQEPGSRPAPHEPSEAEKAAGLEWALGNHQPRKNIGSIPVAWQMRGGE